MRICIAVSTTVMIHAQTDYNDSLSFNTWCSLTRTWKDRPFGVLYAMVAQLFIGKPYKAATLEQSGNEKCTFTSVGFDCVTLTESALSLARSIRLDSCNYNHFISQLERIRYRYGKIDGYLSRLHYTSDWIRDNEAKRILHNITRELGGKPIRKQINFMSTHPDYYPKLQDSSSLIPKLVSIERQLSKHPLIVISIQRLKNVRDKIQSGDIIAIASTKDGLDYTHIGIALRSQGKLGLIHASSKNQQVIYEQSLEEYLRSNKHFAGITVARPVDPLSDLFDTNRRINSSTK